MSKKIVIDPGHGGSDPGTSANGITEKEFTNSKNSYLSATKLSFENTATVSLANAKRLAFYNKAVSKKETIEKLNNVTIEDINSLIKEIFDFNNCCICR